MPAQIAILLAVTSDLFDSVPIDPMPQAEHAVREAASGIPAPICAGFETGDKPSDEDRKTIIDIARRSLTGFQPQPEPEARPDLPTRVDRMPKVASPKEKA